MRNARSQAEGYARALPVDHGWPPFILVCHVGHVLEVYAAVFPPGDLGQTAAVMASLVRATCPLFSYDIAANFRQGRRILSQIEAVLAALVWDGWVSQSEGNAGFVLRKAA